MSPSTQRVLSKLKCNRSRGISFDDFGRGFRLSSHIHLLRRAGFNIITEYERMSNGGNKGRYFLIKAPKCV